MDADSCAICLEVFEIGKGTLVKLKCGHIYHQECFVDLFNFQTLQNKSVLCPLCRFICIHIEEPPAPAVSAINSLCIKYFYVIYMSILAVMITFIMWNAGAGQQQEYRSISYYDRLDTDDYYIMLLNV
jgi:hypothetical protein